LAEEDRAIIGLQNIAGSRATHLRIGTSADTYLCVRPFFYALYIYNNNFLSLVDKIDKVLSFFIWVNDMFLPQFFVHGNKGLFSLFLNWFVDFPTTSCL
jgi:hypothetical protein